MLKFGLDPEFFATVKIDEKSYVISPALLELFSGLKYLYQDDKEKHPVYIKKKFFSWMMDGVAFELTILKPLETAKEMFEVVNNSLDCLNEFLSKFKFEGNEINLYKKPVVNINPDFYLPYLDINKIYQGFIFGCDEDWDAIIPDYKCETVDVLTHLFRYGGGHFHTSGSKSFEKFIVPAIQLYAITVGNFVTKESLFPEEDRQRVSTYGKPGRYRPQKYSDGSFGIEYRTPSNSWLSLPFEKYEEIIFWATKAVELLENQKKGSEIINTFLKPTVEAITTANKNISSLILGELNV